MATSFIGIDPGVNGGIAVITVKRGSPPYINAIPMPRSEREIWQAVQALSPRKHHWSHAALEAVHSMPGQGVKSTFAFGRGYGFLRGCLTAAKIAFEDVRPQDWQRGLDIQKRRPIETQDDFKQRLVEVAVDILGGQSEVLWTIDKRTADAYLMAEFMRRKYRESVK